jgi:hypothetical protein
MVVNSLYKIRFHTVATNEIRTRLHRTWHGTITIGEGRAIKRVKIYNNNVISSGTTLIANLIKIRRLIQNLLERNSTFRNKKAYKKNGLKMGQAVTVLNY